jgi:uncharacterized oxidoreductase
MLTLSPERLTGVGSAIFQAAGAPADIADLVARSLVGSNLAGHDSHGVIQIPGYVDLLRDGRIVAAARPEIRAEGASLIQADGGWGFGQYSAHACMDLALQKARVSQLALCAVTRINHIGRCGEWVEQAAAAGLIGMLGVSWGNGPFAGPAGS